MKSELKVQKIIILAAMMVAFSSCEKSADSFSLLADQNTFKQSTSFVQKPIDILWVIDNSNSMATSQTNIANNFQAFINNFQRLNLDFRMAITTTDAYLADLYYNNNLYSKFRDGSGSSHSGVFVMDKNTPNLSSVFVTNITQGVNGYGDERAFSSFKSTLDNPLNTGFRRADAFLAIIIVSDEDDFSHNSMTFTENYNDSSLNSIGSYVSYLDTFTGYSVGNARNYSVNTISILDSTCQAQLVNQFTGRKISTRYNALVDATGGQKTSLCDDFASNLSLISESAISLSSTFKLERTPVISTINVKVNGQVVAADPMSGWTYDESTNSVTFHGSAVPAAGADIVINYDPTTAKI